MSLRVHVIIDSLAVGGAESLLADFAVGARAVGIDLSIGFLHGDGAAAERLRREGIQPIHVPVESLLGARDRRAVREHVAAVGPELVHTQLDYADVLGSLAARSLGVPSVSTLHVAAWDGGLRDRVRFALIGRVRRRCAAKVIAVSDAARQSYLEHRWDRPERVVTVHNGIVDAVSSGSGAEVRRELGIDDADLVIGMISVLRGGKGHRVAGAAVHRLLPRFPNLRLVVVGDGPERGRIEAEMALLGDAATFAGYRHDVSRVLDAIDVLVHPSSQDAFPTALLEAMRAGVPAVGANVGGIPEALLDGETGYLVGTPTTTDDLVAALVPLLSEPGLRQRIGQQARRRFEDCFSVDRWLERLLPVYGAALSDSGVRSARA